MIARIICLFRGHLWVEVHTPMCEIVPGGRGWMYTRYCERCSPREP